MSTDQAATSLPAGKLPEGKLEHVSLADPGLIFYDSDSYGRKLNERRLDMLRASWDRQKAGVLLVSRRPNPNKLIKDKLLVVIDGHHRVTVAIEKSEPNLPALVWDGLSQQQEASLYAAFGSVLRQSPMQVFRARLVAGDSQAAKLAAWIEDAGFSLNMSGSGKAAPDRLNNVVTLEKMFRRYGAMHLYTVLRTIHDTFPNDPKRTHDPILYAVSLLLRYYPELDKERLIARVEKAGFSTLIANGNGFAHLHKVTAPHGFGFALVEAYNFNGGKMLEQWDRRVPRKEYTEEGKERIRAAIRETNKTRKPSKRKPANGRAQTSKTAPRRTGSRRVIWNPLVEDVSALPS